MAATARRLPVPVELALRRALANVDPKEYERFETRARALLDEARMLRATPESEEEHRLFAGLYRLSFDAYPLMRGALPELYTWFSPENLRDHLREKARGAVATRRFLLRQLEQAAITFAATVQLAAVHIRDEPLELDAIEVAALEAGFWRPPAEAMIPTRFHLDILMALDAVDGPWDDEELRYWVSRARKGATRAAELTRNAIREAFPDPEPLALVPWFDALMENPKERERQDRVVALAVQSNGDAKVERELAAKTTGRR